MNEAVRHAGPESGRDAPGSGAIAVNEGYCINLRGRAEICDLCRRACHAGAITLDANAVTIDADRCTDCGACVPACPGGAITHRDFAPEDLLEEVTRNGRGRIACAAIESRGPRIPCHKMLDARLAAALFGEGMRVMEAAGTEHCGDCPNGDARPALASTARTLGKWFGEAGPRIAVSDGKSDGGIESARPAARRRALLRLAFRALAPPPSFDELASVDDPETAAPARPVPYQAVLADRRAVLPFRPGGPVGATGRTIGETCSGCLICAELCPTGALAAHLAEGERAVSFDPALCTNCTLCLKVCPMEAISPRALRGLDAACAERSPLYARPDISCPECAARFAPAGPDCRLCPACENEKEMDEEWLAMLGD